MGRRTIAAVAAGAALALGTMAAPALASPLDQASTSTFITDATRYVHTLAGEEQAEARAGSRYLLGIRSGCRAMLPPANATLTQTQDGTLGLLVEEGSLRLSVVQLAAVQATERGSSKLFAQLRWSDKSIARAFSLSGETIVRLLRLPTVHLCADIRIAAADDFAKVPAATARFVLAARHAVYPGGRQAPTLVAILKLLKPYVTRADAKAYANLKKLNASYLKSEDTVSLDAFESLVEILLPAPYP